MKEIKLKIDGKETPLTPEQIKALEISTDEECVCDKVEDNEYYYFIGHGGTVRKTMESNAHFDCEAYKCGNYYRDEAYAKQVALHQQLNNLLRRYSEQHGGDAEWDGTKEHWSVYFDCDKKSCHAFLSFGEKSISDVFFAENEVAEKAIEEVVKPFMKEHPDFVW